MLVHLIWPQRSLRLSSAFFILFTLFCFSEVISTILSSSLLIHSSASDILLLIPSRVFLLSVIVLFVSVCFFFYSSSSFSEFSHSVVSYSLQPPRLQHTRPTCQSPTPGIYSNSCPLSQWFHPTISSSVIPFSSCLQYFPASGSFQMSQFSASDGQSTGVTASH